MTDNNSSPTVPPEPRAPAGHSVVLTVAALLVALAAVGFVAWRVWTELSSASISTHGYIALALGALFTLAIGVVLMRLMYISSRRGFDDEAGHD